MAVPPVPTGAPEAKPRPVTVTAGGILMFVLALLALAWGGLTLVTMALTGDDVIREQMEEAQKQGQDIPAEQYETMVNFAKSIAYGTGALIVLFGVVIGVLGFLVLRGSRVGRILSWVSTGFFALCGLCSLGGSAAGQTGAAAALGAIIPVVVLLCSLAVIVLLALPASNAYFAKEVPQWQPPAEFGAQETSTEVAAPGASTDSGATAFGEATPPSAPAAPEPAPEPSAAPETPGDQTPEPPSEQPPSTERPPYTP